MYCTLRAVLVIGFCLLAQMPSAAAAEGDAKAINEQPSVLLETQLEHEKKRLSEAQRESDLLKAELQRIQGYIGRVDAASFNDNEVLANLDAFTTKFREVEASMKPAGLVSLGAYQEMQERLDKLLDRARYPWISPPTGDAETFISELYQLYGAERELFHWGIVDWLSALEQADSVSNQELMKAAVTRAAPLVPSLTPGTFKSAFTASQEKNRQFLRGVQERANNAIKERDGRIKESSERIAKLGELLEKRQQKGETDSQLTLAIYIMIAVVVALYLGTLWFKQDIQTLIFQQRTLVELIGMAFLLLTIIILGTGEKIERSVLGTLLGTVAGYIFGQQMRGSLPKTETQQTAGTQPGAQPNAPSGATGTAEKLQGAAIAGGELATVPGANPSGENKDKSATANSDTKAQG